MPKKSRQKVKYLENEKSFQDEIKRTFHHFWRAIIEANKNFFFERWESYFKNSIVAAMQDSTFSETGSQFFFSKMNRTYVRARS